MTFNDPHILDTWLRHIRVLAEDIETRALFPPGTGQADSRYPKSNAREAQPVSDEHVETKDA